MRLYRGAVVHRACIADATSVASSADLETIRELISSRAGNGLSSIGLGDCTVIVGLRSDAADLAKQIVDAHGDRVTVTVGFFNYPSRAQVSDACPFQGTLADHPSLRATVETASPRIPSGGTFDPTVRITNTGTSSVGLDTSSSLQVYLFLPGGTRPVGASDLVSVGTGLGMAVGPGTSRTIPGVGGTASCDLALGYTLPPGLYRARALVDFARGPEGGSGPQVFWSDALDLGIVPAP